MVKVEVVLLCLLAIHIEAIQRLDTACVELHIFGHLTVSAVQGRRLRSVDAEVVFRIALVKVEVVLLGLPAIHIEAIQRLDTAGIELHVFGHLTVSSVQGRRLRSVDVEIVFRIALVKVEVVLLRLVAIHIKAIQRLETAGIELYVFGHLTIRTVHRRRLRSIDAEVVLRIALVKVEVVLLRLLAIYIEAILCLKSPSCVCRMLEYLAIRTVKGGSTQHVPVILASLLLASRKRESDGL